MNDDENLNRRIPDENFALIKKLFIENKIVDGDDEHPGDLTELGIDMLSCLTFAYVANDHDPEALVNFMCDREIEHRASRVLGALVEVIANIKEIKDTQGNVNMQGARAE